MAQQSEMAAVLVDQLHDYRAEEEVKIDSLEDGAIKATRNYSSGTASLQIRITKMTESQRDELPKQVQRLTDVYVEMASEGRMETEVKDSADLKGVLTFFEGTAGAILIVKGAYLVEYQISGVTGVLASRKIVESLNLSGL